MGYMRGGTILRIDLDSGMIVKEPTAEYEKLPESFIRKPVRPSIRWNRKMC
jgi:hypothetical protein